MAGAPKRMTNCPCRLETRPYLNALASVPLLISTLLITGCAVTKMNSTQTPAPSAGQLAVTPATMDFGSINVGVSKSQSGTLTAGASAVTVSSASWNGTGYSLAGITFPATVAAGQSVPFTVTFTPQASGNAAGTVSFLSSASNSPSVEQWAGSGIQSGQHQVALSWNQNTSSVQGYYVYRGAQTGGPYSRISILQAGTAFNDGAVSSGQTYYYVVTALGTNSLESGYSNEAVANIP
jgi:Abnormal spindle-like microcephaly-assoc'd, ASPM-SPD-2-Hydin